MRGGRPRYEDHPSYHSPEYEEDTPVMVYRGGGVREKGISRYNATRDIANRYEQYDRGYQRSKGPSPRLSTYDRGNDDYDDEYSRGDDERMSVITDRSRYRRDNRDALDYSRQSSPYSTREELKREEVRRNGWDRDGMRGEVIRDDGMRDDGMRDDWRRDALRRTEWMRDNGRRESLGREEMVRNGWEHEDWGHIQGGVITGSRKRGFVDTNSAQVGYPEWQRAQRPFRRSFDREEADYERDYEQDEIPSRQSDVPADLSLLLKNRQARSRRGEMENNSRQQERNRSDFRSARRQEMVHADGVMGGSRRRNESGPRVERNTRGGGNTEQPLRIRPQQGNLVWEDITRIPRREDFERMTDHEYEIACKFPYGIMNRFMEQEWEFVDPNTKERIEDLTETVQGRYMDIEDGPRNSTDMERPSAYRRW